MRRVLEAAITAVLRFDIEILGLIPPNQRNPKVNDLIRFPSFPCDPSSVAAFPSGFGKIAILLGRT